MTTRWCVRWDHINGRDRSAGEPWDHREDAQWMADMLERSGWAENVRIDRC